MFSIRQVCKISCGRKTQTLTFQQEIPTNSPEHFLFLTISASTLGKEMKAVASKGNYSFFFVPPTHALKRRDVWEEHQHLSPLAFPLLHLLHPKIKQSSNETWEAFVQKQKISKSVRDCYGNEDKGLPDCISYINIHKLITLPALNFNYAHMLNP